MSGEHQAQQGRAGAGRRQQEDGAVGLLLVVDPLRAGHDEINSRTPSDIPDLVSEDIVAKQLREAALAEDDPELRDRLWDEYRKYNGLK